MKNVTPAKLRSFYISALCLIALLVSLSEYQFGALLDHQKEESTIINRAGEQRMLSQKIALYLNRLSTDKKTDDSRNRSKQIISDAVVRLKDNHEFLIQLRSLPNAASKLYFDSPQSLDERIKDLIGFTAVQVGISQLNNTNYQFNESFDPNQAFFEQLLFDRT